MCKILEYDNNNNIYYSEQRKTKNSFFGKINTQKLKFIYENFKDQVKMKIETISNKNWNNNNGNERTNKNHKSNNNKEPFFNKMEY